MKQIKVKYIVYLGAFILFVVLGFFSNKNDEIIILNNEDFFENSGEKTVDLIYVHIIGEINEPGIKVVSKGCRLFELINIAGGTTSDADLSRVNLASVLKDEQKVVIPSIIIQTNDNSSKSIEKTDVSNELLININACSKEELKKLSGIGESMAQRIIDYRNENGYFSSIEEIKKVSGIGNAKFDKIKENISI